MASIAKAIPQDAVQERVSTDPHARQFKVASRTVTGVQYLVNYFDDTTTRCSCPAGSQGKNCWHKTSVKQFIANEQAEFDAYVAARMAETPEARKARIQAEEDAELQRIVGAWWQAQYGDLTAQEVLDAEYEREEAAFWQDFNASRDLIVAAIMLRIDGYLPKEQPMQETVILCKHCGKRCNGQTGLCYRCEQEQRKAESRKAQTCQRSSRWNDERVFDPIIGWKSAS